MTVTQALGWALVHSLWQCALAAAGLAALLAVLPPRAARARYALAVATLALTLALPIGTLVRLHGASSETSAASPITAAPAPASRAPAASPQPMPLSPQATHRYGSAAPAIAVLRLVPRIRARLEPLLPWIVVLWLTGVVALSLRLASGWLAARRLRALGTRPAPEPCVAALRRLAARLRVSRPVRLLQSTLVQVPAVLGWVRPVILLPASALTGLTPLQLEALLAHELAHVRRYDYLVNLVQSVIETLLFYHPAVWWISARVRDERERCCDDLAVAVCGDPHFYASALLGMERLRVTAPTLALSAAGGSLMGRVRRLVAPPPMETFPRWTAGVMAASLVLAAGGSRLLRSGATPPSDAASTAPASVVRYPDPAQRLAQRWDWALERGARMGGGFWIGYRVQQAASVPQRSEQHQRGRHDEWRGEPGAGGFRGVPLAPVIADSGDEDDLALLFHLRTRGPGQTTLESVRVTSLSLPVDLERAPLVWLGPADDAASLTRLQALFAAAHSADLREDLVTDVGLHGSSQAVVPLLDGWLRGDASAGVRAQAAEWLGHHPDAAAVRALASAARHDPASRVREEAVKALRINPFPAATDSLLALAQTHDDSHVRREAVEGLDHKSDPRVLPVTIAIARSDRDEDVQREAIEGLGEMKEPGLRAVIAIARTHPDPDVRSRAVKTVAEAAPQDVALRLLEDVARHDPDRHVQREAVEALGKVGGPRAVALVIAFAHHHPAAEVRREAVKQLGELDPSDSTTTTLLEQTAVEGSDVDFQREAVEALASQGSPQALEAVARLARVHSSADVRREAAERYAKVAAPESARLLLTDRLANDRSPAVQSEALRRLMALPG
ncbi:MAG TPA: M56 family metallopeptidase, partial [Gemmatimonadales bacterium]|nr:M56 family metallopeptidase [Gemmatimonadales bacterium]